MIMFGRRELLGEAAIVEQAPKILLWKKWRRLPCMETRTGKRTKPRFLSTIRLPTLPIFLSYYCPASTSIMYNTLYNHSNMASTQLITTASLYLMASILKSKLGTEAFSDSLAHQVLEDAMTTPKHQYVVFGGRGFQ